MVFCRDGRSHLRFGLLALLACCGFSCQSWNSFWAKSEADATAGHSAKGTVQPRRHLIVTAGTAQTGIFSEESATIIAGPQLTSAAGTGVQLWNIPLGPQQGKTLVVHGDGTGTTTLFDPATNTMSIGPVLSGFAGANALAFDSVIGNRWMVLHGNGNNSASLYDSATDTFFSSTASQQTLSTNPHASYVASGPRTGTHLVLYGSGSSLTSYADTALLVYATGPALPSPLGTNSVAFTFSEGALAGKTRILAGDGTANVFEFDPFIAVPAITTALATGFTVSTGAFAFRIRAGASKGGFVVMQGGSSPNARIMLPDGSWYTTFAASYTTSAGANAIEVDAGPLAGKTLLTTGASFNLTHSFDPETSSFAAAAGPVLPFNLGTVTRSIAVN